MKTVDYFPLSAPANSKPSTLALLSGETIHIIYPNGQVEMVTTEYFHQNITQDNLRTCLVWGRLDEF